ncbi:MAG TPA: hypothetical protein VHP80_14990 [Candidatus Acidoferrum sp.]|nr:hypothetical protein [Candidatus Acidoferrum sp.]
MSAIRAVCVGCAGEAGAAVGVWWVYAWKAAMLRKTAGKGAGAT